MADPSDIVKRNVDRRFYVDYTCIYCDLCRELAPDFFAEDKTEGVAYVFHQPVSDEEIQQATEVIEMCPTESIGDRARPGIEIGTSLTPASESARRWWRFWK